MVVVVVVVVVKLIVVEMMEEGVVVAGVVAVAGVVIPAMLVVLMRWWKQWWRRRVRHVSCCVLSQTRASVQSQDNDRQTGIARSESVCGPFSRDTTRYCLGPLLPRPFFSFLFFVFF